MTTGQQVTGWLREYEQAWRAPGTDPLRRLFTDHASYSLGPYEAPAVGLDAIGELWNSEREGPDETFTMSAEIVAVDGDVSVVRVEVRYGEPPEREYRDLWLLRFAPDGRCSAFEEWPFWPERAYKAPEAR